MNLKSFTSLLSKLIFASAIFFLPVFASAQVVVTSPVSGTYITSANENSITLSGSCAPGSSVSYTLSPISGTGPFTGTMSCLGLIGMGSFSTDLDLSNIVDYPEGFIGVEVSQNSTTENLSLFKDLTPPTVTIASSPDITNTAGNNNPYTISGTCASPSPGIPGEISLTINGAVFPSDGNATNTGTMDCSGGTWEFDDINMSGVAEGNFNISLSQFDNAGNEGVATATANKDTTTSAPTVTILTFPTATSQNELAYGVGGFCQAGAGDVTVQVEGVNTANNPVTLQQDVSCVTLGFISSWEATFNVSSIADGANALTITASQTSGGLTGDDVEMADKVALSVNTTPTITDPALYTASGMCDVGAGSISLAATNATIPGSSSTTCDSAGEWTANITAITADVDMTVTQNGVSVTETIPFNTTSQLSVNTTPSITTSNGYLVTGMCDVGAGSLSLSPTNATIAGSNTASCDSAGEWSATLLNATADVDMTVTQNGVSVTETIPFNTTSQLSVNTTPSITTSNGYLVTGMCDVGAGSLSLSPTNATIAGSNTASCDSAGEWSATLLNATADVDMTVTQNGVSVTETIPFNTTSQLSVNTTPSITTSNGYLVTGMCDVGAGSLSLSPTNATIAGSNTASCDSAGEWSATLLNATADVDMTVTQNGVSVTETIPLSSSTGAVTISTPQDANIDNQGAYVVGGTCEMSVGEVTVAISGATPTTQDVVCLSSVWAATFDVTLIPDGSPAFTIDAAQGASSASEDVRKDTVAPTPTITSALDVPTADASSYEISGTCTAGGGQTVVTVTTPSTGSTIVATGSSGCSGSGPGNWSVTGLNISAIPDGAGNIEITAVQTDAVGNSGTASDLADVNAPIDTTDPVVTIDSLDTITSSNEDNYPVSGTCTFGDEQVTFTIPGLSASPTSCLSGGTWTTSFDVSGLTDGDNALSVTAEQLDASNNLGSDNLTIDKYVDSSGGSGNSGGFGGIRRSIIGRRSITAQSIPTAQCTSFHFTEYLMPFSPANNPAEVSKVQQFLNTHLGKALVPDGIFGSKTLTAIMQFQARYYDTIIKPYVTLIYPTGVWGPTTRATANYLRDGCFEGPVFLEGAGYYSLQDALHLRQVTNPVGANQQASSGPTAAQQAQAAGDFTLTNI